MLLGNRAGHREMGIAVPAGIVLVVISKSSQDNRRLLTAID